MTQSIAEVLAAAKPRESSVTLCMAGDLAAEFDALEHRLTELRRTAPGDSLAGNGSAEIAERMAGVRRAMAESEVVFTFRAISRKAWSDLLTAHPAPLGADTKYSMDTLVPAVVAASAIDPKMSIAEANTLCDTLSSGQVDALFVAAWDVNTGSGEIPFSGAAFALLPSSPQN